MGIQGLDGVYGPGQVAAGFDKNVNVFGRPGPAGPTTDRLGPGQDERDFFVVQSLENLPEIYGNGFAPSPHFVPLGAEVSTLAHGVPVADAPPGRLRLLPRRIAGNNLGTLLDPRHEKPSGNRSYYTCRRTANRLEKSFTPA